jgi:hypothetical protein
LTSSASPDESGKALLVLFDDVGVMAHSKTDEAWLKKTDEYIRFNIKDPNIYIATLAEHMFMSRTTFYRKKIAFFLIGQRNNRYNTAEKSCL